ncbi:MAG TPA: HAMP domain-containing sensor histidine kinase [Blastococcus sp.]
MRRQITLLVAATTSIVLLAFLLPAAGLVARVAEARALDAARAQVQFLSPTVGLAGRDEVAAALLGATSDLDVAVLWTDGEWLGRHQDGGPTEPTTTAAVLEEDGARRVLQPVQRVDGTAVVEVYIPAAQVRSGVTGTWLVLAALGAVLLGLSLLVADRLARSLTRPVTDLARTARRLSAGDLGARTTPAGPPEVRDVAAAVDQLAGRIGALLTAEREAAADLAHRLRTPLTALQLDAEALPQGHRENLLDGVDAVSRAVDEVIREVRRPVREGLAASSDAIAVGRDRAHFWSALAADEGRPLTVEIPLPDQPLPVRVPADDLTAAVDALLGNVFAHTPDGTPFTLAVEPRDGGGAVVTVRDRGPGMPASAVQRGASGRGSTGLGLDIARRTAEASGGALRVDSSPAGTTVTLALGPPVAV